MSERYIKESKNIIEIDDKESFTDFNKRLLSSQKVEEFKVKSKGKEVLVDLINAKIQIDNKEVDLNIDKDLNEKLKTAELRCINFKRVTMSFHFLGNKYTTNEKCIGFQTTINGKNIKRFVRINDKSEVFVEE